MLRPIPGHGIRTTHTPGKSARYSGNIPTFIHISDGKLHDVNVLDILLPEAGAFYIMDRGYIDFSRLYTLDLSAAFFVTRGKSNLKCRRLYSRPVDKQTGLIYDQSVVLTGFYASKDYPDKLRRIKYHDAKTDKTVGDDMCNQLNLIENLTGH